MSNKPLNIWLNLWLNSNKPFIEQNHPDYQENKYKFLIAGAMSALFYL